MPWIERERVNADSGDFDTPRLERVSDGAVLSVNDDEAIQFLTEFNNLLSKYRVERRLGPVVKASNSETFIAGGRILDAVKEWTGDEVRNIYCEVATLKRVPSTNGNETPLKE